MKDLADLHAAAISLARDSHLSAREAEARLERAVDRAYWESLSPQIEIGRRAELPDIKLAPDVQQQCEQFYAEERYFEMPVLLAEAALEHLNAVVDAVTAAGWPAVFAIVSDAFWLVPRIPAVRHLITSRLGEGYRQIPHVWLHVVRSIDGAGGWQPHFDGFRQNRLSLWVALSDATTTNGCMHLVPPRSLPPSFRTLKIDTLRTVDVIRAMHATRALPVRAGAAVGWDFDVFHWGGRTVRPGFERRALSMEFLGPAEEADPDEIPIIDPQAPLPTFATRLKVISIGLDTYAKREPFSARFRSLADRLA